MKDKHKKQRLRESENRYRTLFEGANDAILIMSGTNVIECNKRALEMFGAKREQLVGISVSDISAEFQPDGKPTADEVRRRVNAALDGRPQLFEWRHKRLDGSPFDAEISLDLIEFKREMALQSIIRDITERKSAEELLSGQKRILEMIATNAPLGETLAAIVDFLESGSRGTLASILLLDEDGVHVRHGAAPNLPEAYIKAVDGAAIGPRAGSCGTAMFRREPVIVTDILHDPLWEGYRHLIVPYGLLACWSTPIISHSGRVLGSFAIYYREVRSPAHAEKQLVDIATHIASIAIEHCLSDQKIRQARHAAEAANLAKSQFLANMSHELRTPMAGVLGMLEIALDGPLEAKQREFIQTAHYSAGSLVRILNDILEMTRVEAGMLSIEENPFPLRDCVAGVVDIFVAEARRKGLVLVLSMADDVPKTVVGDQVRLRQVLTNLVGNAVKFTERGKVELKVEALSAIPTGNREVTFTVTDTGIGIPDDKKPLIFRPFSQVDDSHSRRYGGTGLGLVISREIVERMGGTIVFDSKEGMGCIFTVTVPFGEPESGQNTETGEPGSKEKK